MEFGLTPHQRWLAKLPLSKGQLNRLMNSRSTTREYAICKRNHRKWPLGTPVLVNTPQGYLLGTVSKHGRLDRFFPEHGCWVDFSPTLVDMGDGWQTRSKYIPFRSMKKIKLPELSIKFYKGLNLNNWPHIKAELRGKP